MNNKEKPSYYAILPADVRYDNRLSPMAKLLYAEITALSQKEGYSWASNRYFGDLYDLSSGRVSHLVAELSGAGYITVEIINQTDRKIYIKGVAKNSIPLAKNSRGGSNKQKGGVAKNSYITLQENNIINKENDVIKKVAARSRASRATALKVRDELARRGIVKPILGSASRVA